MSSSKLTCKLFKLNGVKDLEDIETLILSKQHLDPLVVARQDTKLLDQLPEKEKNFYYNWHGESGICELKIPEKDIADENKEKVVQFVYATANIEYPKMKKKNADGDLLPKSLRTNVAKINTYFILIDESIYVVICTSNAIFQQRVKKLIGKNLFGEIDESFQIPPDLFNWMFYQFLENKGVLEEGLKIESIDGFIGNSIDEHNIFKGTSDQTSELIITKAFISNGEILNTITARIQNDDLDISFALDHKCNTQIYTNLSREMRVMDVEREQVFYVIYLYSYLIPRLKKVYSNSSSAFLGVEGKEFSAKIGLEVIKSIIEFNSLSLEKIEELYNSLDSSITSNGVSKISL
ncbi:hypothetical protein [Exiguobacterium sp. NG55]|uniref:hypothetical protein n=1 Tax=Exiguobacterium sp. NG55 TaxID=375477 RepID=UPI00068C5F8C|nr:hypothetical protein [Exiguobacterium sp. NG55]